MLVKHDRVVETSVLLDAAALGAAWRRPVGEHGGRRATRIDLAEPFVGEVVPPLVDLRAFDQIVMVFRTAGGTVRPTLGIELTTQTEGLSAPDSFSTGHAPELTAEDDWARYPFPWENFLIFGQGERVYPVRRMALTISAATPGITLWLAELRVERRARAAGPRLTDAGLAAELDGFDGPGLLAHLRARKQPRHAFGATPAAATDGATLAQADAICRHHINGYEVGDPVNWRLNPNGYLEWMHAFNRQGWMNTLVAAYRGTGDARYVRKRIKLTGDGARAPLRLVTVVLPFAQGVSSGVRVRLRRTPAAADRVTLEVRTAAGATETITYGWRDGLFS